MPLFATHRVLKADTAPTRLAPVSFQYADINERCDEQLELARTQARQLLVDAESQAEQLLDEARQIGHATGSLEAEAEYEARITAEVDRRVGERLDQLVPSLTAAISKLERDRAEALQQWEKTVVGLSLCIAEKILRRSLQTATAIPRELITEVLRLTAGAGAVTLRLNPSDAREISQNAVAWRDLLAQQPGLKLIADPQISPGGCYVETPTGKIDARIETQLARIATELLD